MIYLLSVFLAFSVVDLKPTEDPNEEGLVFYEESKELDTQEIWFGIGHDEGPSDEMDSDSE